MEFSSVDIMGVFGMLCFTCCCDFDLGLSSGLVKQYDNILQIHQMSIVLLKIAVPQMDVWKIEDH